MTDQVTPTTEGQIEKPTAPTEKTTADKKITLSFGQAITVISVALGTIMTIAYAIASFLQTKYIVEELKKSSEKVQTDIDSLKQRTQSLSTQIDTKTADLAQLIKENCNPKKK